MGLICSYSLSVNDFSPKLLHLLLGGIYSSHQPKAQRVIAWNFIAWAGGRGREGNCLFKIICSEQRKWGKTVHFTLSTAVWQYSHCTAYKAPVLIFLFTGPPTSFFFDCEGCNGLNYTLLVGMLTFFFVEIERD